MWFLIVLVWAYLVLANLYAWALPVFEGPDAFSHFATIVFYRSGFRLPKITSEAALVYGNELIVQPPLYYILSGWAIRIESAEPSLEFVRRSYNRYFEKGLSYRITLLLPQEDTGTLRAAWIARRVSMLGGLLALLGMWRWARVLFPGWVWLQVAATAVVAFNPEFLYLSSSITNDAWTAATAIWVLALATEMALRVRGPWAWLRVGIALGIASLTKYSTLLTLIPVALLGWIYLQRRGTWAALKGAMWVVLGFILMSGWWFARNWALYHELIPLNTMDQAIGLRRPHPLDFSTTLSYVPWLLISFWGSFLRVTLPDWSLESAKWFTTVGLLGFLLSICLGQSRFKPRPNISAGISLVLLIHMLVTIAGVLYWTSTVNFGEHGRFAFVGLGAFGMAMALGWAFWFPIRWHRSVMAGILGWMLVFATIGWLTARSAFALPPALPQSLKPQREIQAHFEGGMRLLGIDFPHGAAARPGQSIPIILYWTTDALIQEDYTFFLHLVDEKGTMLFQFDGVPVRGGHPTRQWRPGWIFADPYQLRIPESAKPGIAVLWAGFYTAEHMARIPAYGSDGKMLGREIMLARVRVMEPVSWIIESQPGVIARWSNGIYLRMATPIWGPEGQPIGLTLAWGTFQTIHQDYQVFVHVVDAHGHLLAQADHEPQQGRAPTSTWRTGDMIIYSIHWPPPGPNWAAILVGLYQLSTGERLAVVDPSVAHHAVPVLRREP